MSKYAIIVHHGAKSAGKSGTSCSQNHKMATGTKIQKSKVENVISCVLKDEQVFAIIVHHGAKSVGKSDTHHFCRIRR